MDFIQDEERTILLSERFRQLLRRDPHTCPTWPPDLFACCSVVLRETGAYERVVELCVPDLGVEKGSWPLLGREWAAEAQRLGCEWRARIDEDDNLALDPDFSSLAPPTEFPVPPEKVQELWSELVGEDCRNCQLASLRQETNNVKKLLQLLAIADEACAGIGLKPRSGEFGVLRRLTERLLASKNFQTVCWEIPRVSAMVLPKQHTPQRGLTLRSLSHHLALLPHNGVKAQWVLPNTISKEQRSRLQLLNILILPWPLTVDRRLFRVVHEEEGIPPTSSKFRFFTYLGPNNGEFRKNFENIVNEAKRHAVDIDLVIFPELALTYNDLMEAIPIAERNHAALIAGVSAQPGAHLNVTLRGPGNLAVTDITGWLDKSEDTPLSDGMGEPARDVPSPDGAGAPPGKEDSRAKNVLNIQKKHHRWCLDKDQIKQYSLQGWLPTTSDYWEFADIGPREISFQTIENWLTIGTLICEDLARQDPMAEVLRTVAPNLVVALLMDGPQLGNRWGARYATVLAEDPGCSVLTLTSLGMSRLTREHSEKLGWKDRSRAVALWRDIENGDQVIELPEGAVGAVLHVVCKRLEEFTADGRGDGGVASFPILSGWTPLKFVEGT